MKLLGLSFGRRMENTEILVKEAMMGAEELGMDVGMIRMLDLNIKPCKGCNTCVRSLMEGKTGKCVIKDDLYFVDEQLMGCDALILGAPVFGLAPTGLFKTVCDRFGPSHDVAVRMEAKKISEGRGKGKGPDERSFKTRVGAFISVGGATTPNWASFGLPLMNTFTFSSHITVVDQMQVLETSRYGNVVLNEGALKRARRLGRNVARAMATPIGEVKWMGDEPGTCPVCHSNLLTVTNRNPIECPICGISGEIKVEGDKISVTFSEKEQKRSRLTLAGKLEHNDELRHNFGIFAQRQDKDQIPARLEKYKGYRELKMPHRKLK
jgi:multimeric flavodoxin WrbA